MNIVHQIYCSNLGVLTVSTLILSFIFCVLNHYLKKNKWFNICCIIGFIIYTIIILYVTVFGRKSSYNHQIILIPFHSYVIALSGNEEGFRTCFMNILLFYPLGIISSGIENKKMNYKYLLIFSLTLSLFIEIIQYIFGLGLAEIDDLINNTFGALLSYYICIVLSKIIKKFFELIKMHRK